MRTTLLTMALAGVPILSACRSTPPTLRDPGLASSAVTADQWIGAARQPFEAGEPDGFASPALLAALDGARIVGIGEATHGTHEDALLKTRLILALIEQGAIDTLYIEANRTGAAQLDAFIRSQDGDAAAAVRDAAIFRVLKTQAVADCVAGMQERMRRGARLRIVGIDCQDTARDANFALDALATRDARAAAELRNRLEPVAGEKARALRHPQLIKSIDTAQVDSCSAALAELENACRRTGEPEAARAAIAARQGLLAFRLEVADGDQSKINGEYVSPRDKFMAENILADGAHRGAFWGHNRHVIGGRVAAGPEFWSPTGAFLRDALGELYRTVIFDYTRGTIRVVVRSGNTLPDATTPAEVISRGLLEKGYARDRWAFGWIMVDRSPRDARWRRLRRMAVDRAADRLDGLRRDPRARRVHARSARDRAARRRVRGDRRDLRIESAAGSLIPRPHRRQSSGGAATALAREQASGQHFRRIAASTPLPDRVTRVDAPGSAGH